MWVDGTDAGVSDPDELCTDVCRWAATAGGDGDGLPRVWGPAIPEGAVPAQLRTASSERAGDCEAYVRLRIGGVRESEQKWRVRACATTVVALAA